MCKYFWNTTILTYFSHESLRFHLSADQVASLACMLIMNSPAVVFQVEMFDLAPEDKGYKHFRLPSERIKTTTLGFLLSCIFF